MALQPSPDDGFERAAIADGFAMVAGVDEVGRGPIAGPVTAAAARLDLRSVPPGLRDSKQLAPAAREALAETLIGVADIGIGHASVAEIEALNILAATHLAMRRAVAALSVSPAFLLIDGNRAPRDLDLPHRTLVKGDARCLSIAAASVVAKVERDRIMAQLAEDFPGYGWERNAGYPTQAHKRALASLGITPHHRRTFRPVHNILYSEAT